MNYTTRKIYTPQFMKYGCINKEVHFISYTLLKGMIYNPTEKLYSFDYKWEVINNNEHYNN